MQVLQEQNAGLAHWLVSIADIAAGKASLTQRREKDICKPARCIWPVAGRVHFLNSCNEPLCPAVALLAIFVLPSHVLLDLSTRLSSHA
jgi:hypothetical protein